MTGYKLTVIRLEEIKDCSVACANCKTQVTVALDRVISLPNQCPSCNRNWDDNLIKALAGLRQAHECAPASPFRIEFHIKEGVGSQREEA